jgi:hypothetical protein
MLEGPHGPHLKKDMPHPDSRPVPSRIKPVRSGSDTPTYFRLAWQQR